MRLSLDQDDPAAFLSQAYCWCNHAPLLGCVYTTKGLSDIEENSSTFPCNSLSFVWCNTSSLWKREKNVMILIGRVDFDFALEGQECRVLLFRGNRNLQSTILSLQNQVLRVSSGTGRFS